MWGSKKNSVGFLNGVGKKWKMVWGKFEKGVKMVWGKLEMVWGKIKKRDEEMLKKD